MFTNLAFDELLIAVRSAYAPTFIQGHMDIKCPDVEDIIFLLQFVLKIITLRLTTKSISNDWAWPWARPLVPKYVTFECSK